MRHFINFKNHYLSNQVVADLKLREKKQYDTLKVKLLDNNIVRLNPEKKCLAKTKENQITR